MPAVLIVEDDVLAASAIARVIRTMPQHAAVGSTVAVAHTVAAARQHLARADGDLLAAVLDVRLPDGDGLELLGEARARIGGLPVLIMTGHHAEAELSQRAYLLGAAFVAKPVDPQVIKRFILEAVTRRFLRHVNLEAVVALWIRRSRLSQRQGQLLISAVAGETPEKFRGDTGIAANTYKKLVRDVLSRCGEYAKLDDLVTAILRDAIVGAPPAG